MNNYKTWYYIHGVLPWTKNCYFGKFSPQISISLHHDNYTKPLYPYGYILEILKTKIIRAFDCDVTSETDSIGNKSFSRLTCLNSFRNYHYSELNTLIRNTKMGSHNEIWIQSEHVEIVGIYINKEVPGVNSFKKAARKNNIIVPQFS